MASGSTGRRYDAEFMRVQLGRARERGWSLVRLARESGISLPTLCRWRRQIEGERRASQVGFVDVTEALAQPDEPKGQGPPLEVVLRSGHRLLVAAGVATSLLRRVVATLEAPC